MKIKKKRVAVGMSGGVDSSVAVAVLKEEGYDVIGITVEMWSSDPVHDARKVAEDLEIPFYVVDLKDDFEKCVIKYFTSEYMRGNTPNPCVACNKYIKFSSFLQKALSLGADYIATGHYAKIKYISDADRFMLYKANDDHKDQSYFLYNLSQYQLAHTIFPLGEYTKQQIRQKAEKIGLKVADKPESQEICFIPNNDYKNFLLERVGTNKFKPGNFVNMKGKIIGEHQGIPFYTIGQRKGMGLALGYPAYVVAINKDNNTVVVDKEEELFKKGLYSKDHNYIAIEDLKEQMIVQAKIRYGAKPSPAVITPEDDERVKVIFETEQRAITPGQAIVYYQDDLVVGGGTIDEVIK